MTLEIRNMDGTGRGQRRSKQLPNDLVEKRRYLQLTELRTETDSHPSIDRPLAAEVGFKLRLVHVTFVVDKMTLGHVPPPPFSVMV